MKRPLKGLFVLCIIMHLMGCAGLLRQQPVAVPLAEQCRARASEYEKRGELQKALLNLKIADSLSPGDEQIARKIADLKATIESNAAGHFKQGMAYYRKGRLKKAQKEFLIALRYDPCHKDALEHLKGRPVRKGFITYKVKKGNSLEDIAVEVYKDPGMDFLVAYIMGLDLEAKPDPGTLIELPVLEPQFLKQLIDVEKSLSEGRSFFKAKEYEKALASAQRVLDVEPESKEAADLKNVSCFRLGKRLVLKRKYPESLEMFIRVDPGYEGLGKAISEVKENIARQAEIHYRRGVKLFLNEDLENAIVEWEETLVLNPDHQKAKRDIEEARKLLKKLEQFR
jgi:tetratricopeptide (TPR) repeat protein